MRNTFQGGKHTEEKEIKNQRLRIRKIRSNNLNNSEISYNVSNCMAQKKINPSLSNLDLWKKYIIQWIFSM